MCPWQTLSPQQEQEQQQQEQEQEQQEQLLPRLDLSASQQVKTPV